VERPENYSGSTSRKWQRAARKGPKVCLGYPVQSRGCVRPCVADRESSDSLGRIRHRRCPMGCTGATGPDREVRSSGNTTSTPAECSHAGKATAVVEHLAGLDQLPPDRRLVQRGALRAGVLGTLPARAFARIVRSAGTPGRRDASAPGSGNGSEPGRLRAPRARPG
jgi:hypothetical protein